MGDLLELLAMIFVLGVPSLSLAAHFVLRPLVRDIVKAIREPKSEEETAERLAALEARLDQLTSVTERLVEVERFRRELEARDAARLAEGAVSGKTTMS